jgi:hypothetical protein
VLVPKDAVGPYTHQYVVARPFGSTLPVKVAVLGVTAAPPVLTVGAAADAAGAVVARAAAASATVRAYVRIAPSTRGEAACCG